MIKSNKNYVFVALCLAVVLCTAMLLVGLNFNQSVYADYDDLDPNSIVTFNQIFNFGNVNRNDNGVTWVTTTYNPLVTLTINNRNNDMYTFNSGYMTFVEGHSYYIKSSNPNVHVYVFGSAYNNIVAVANSSQDLGLIVNDVFENGTVLNVYINIIDLTVMFGSSFEPTTEVCHELFTAEYYPYNIGIPISFNSVNGYTNGYTQGFNDAWESQNVTYKQNVIGSSAFPYNWNEYNESTKAFDGINMAYLIGGVIGVPLGNIVSGTNIEVDFNFLVTDWSQEPISYRQDFNLYFYYIDSNSNLVLCGTIPYYNIDGAYGTYKGSFNVPINTDTIYMYFSTSPNNWDTSPTLALVFDSSMVFRTQDVYSAINTAFQSGVDSVIQSYSEGGVYYNRIYQAGKTAGINEQNPYTFGYLMSSVIEAPLNAVLGIFNFDFMGYNFKDVITLLLTVCVIIAVVRMFVGGAA